MTLLQPRHTVDAARCARPPRIALPLAVAASFTLACGGTHDRAADDVAKAPGRSGDVWELDGASDRKTAPAALLAFVSGTHVVLVDGVDTYAGMHRTHGGAAPDGGQPLTLGGGIAATLAPAGEAMALRFATGETLALRRRDAGSGSRR